MANCIPIYWGDPVIGKVFNKRAFINVQDYTSVDEVVEKVKEIDSNDKLYYEMLCEPALSDPQYTKDNQLIILQQFLQNIFHDFKCKQNDVIRTSWEENI